MANRKAGRLRRFALAVFIVAAGYLALYVIYPWTCRRSASAVEARLSLPGDTLVQGIENGYTLASSIAAAPEDVWPWLVQMGQGRGGFYTHQWLEYLLGADIHNAEAIVTDLQYLAVGDSIRLTPDPYLGRLPGQYLVVARMTEPHTLVLSQRMPNGATGTWTYVLETRGAGTRLLFRRRSGQASLFDRVMMPGYYIMDMGMLAGIRKRAERNAG